MNWRTKILCPEYLQFIRDKPCVTCQKEPPSDPDHLVARGFGSGKQNDLTAIPMCRLCHSQREQIGNEDFGAKWRINLWQQVSMCLIEFFSDAERRKGVSINVSEKDGL